MALNFVQVGKRVSEVRKRRGLSQQRLSEIICKSPTYISYIEGGLKCMSLDTFVAVANALQVSADELLKDNIENTIVVSNHEFAKVISDCSEYEKRILLSIATSAKESLRENFRFISNRRK